jgi:hypothetical protein
MFNKIKTFFRNLKVRLTYIHLLSFAPDEDIFEDGKWYTFSMYIKRDKLGFKVDDIKIYKTEK